MLQADQHAAWLKPSTCLAGRAEGDWGLAVGSRAHLEKEALAKRSWARNFLMRGFHVLVLVVSGGAVRDTQCGFKVLPPTD